MPNTKPDIEFNSSGVSGCISFDKRKEINWEERSNKFLQIIDEYKKNLITIIIVLSHVAGVKIAIIKS